MQKKKVWLAATASVGIHIGLLALLSQAQAMPKVAPSAQLVTISVSLNTTTNSVANQQQTQIHQSPIVPEPAPSRPAVVKTSAQATKPAAKPAKPKTAPQKTSDGKATLYGAFSDGEDHSNGKISDVSNSR